MAFQAPFDPTVDNDETEGFAIGGEWLNTATNELFRTTDVSTGAAVWPPVGGGNLSFLSWKFSTSTTAADPGKGRFRMNSAAPGSVTAVYFDEQTDGGLNIRNLFDDLTAGQRLGVQQADDPGKVLVFQISGLLIDNTGWWTIPVTALDTSGTLFENNKPAVWAFRLSGISVSAFTLDVDEHALGGSSHEADTLANLNSKVTDATLDDAGDPRPPTAHAHAHADTTGQTADDHHSEAHTIASHSDTTATGAELETLTDGSNADALHVHAAVSVAHSATTGQTADDHHAEAHTVASHSDTTATGAELETLTDGSNADALHVHATPSIAHSATTGQGTDDHHAQVHALGGSDHTSATLAELNALVSNATLDDSGDARTPTAHNHAAGDITSGTLADARVAQSNVTQHQAAIDHDALTNFAAGEHRIINDAGTSATELWSASKISTELASTGGADLWSALNANNATFPASNPAAASSRNGHPILAFDDTTAENVIFSPVMSNDYSAGNLTIDIDWVAETATTGGVTWGVEFERVAPGGTDIDSDSFHTQQTGTSTTNGTSGIKTRTSITLTQAEADGIAAGDAFRLRVQRVTGDGGDTLADDAQILGVIGRQ